MGDNRNSIFRLLAARVVESSAPTQLSLRKVSKKHLKPPRLLNSGNAGCLGCIGHRGSVQTVCFTHPVELQELFWCFELWHFQGDRFDSHWNVQDVWINTNISQPVNPCLQAMFLLSTLTQLLHDYLLCRGARIGNCAKLLKATAKPRRTSAYNAFLQSMRRGDWKNCQLSSSLQLAVSRCRFALGPHSGMFWLAFKVTILFSKFQICL